VGYASKDALLGASDLVERDVELPTVGLTVRVRSLPAAYSNQAMSQAVEMKTSARGEQSAHVSTEKLECLQVLHGLIDPKLGSIEEVRTFALNCGPAFKEVVRVIDEISGIDKEAIERTNATFPAGGTGPGGEDVADAPANGRDRSDLPVRTGA
jgi:hypothetical protein